MNVENLVDIRLDLGHEGAHEDRHILQGLEDDVVPRAFGQEMPRPWHVLRSQLRHDLAHLFMQT